MQNTNRAHRPKQAQAQTESDSPLISLSQPWDHPFRAIIFDWDGTAVVNRQEDASEFVQIATTLLEQQVWLVVVTGTNFGHIARQFCDRIAPAQRHHLLVCVNRGSEVYGFDHRGQAIRRHLYAATPAEERALTVVAEGVAAYLRATAHLEVQIVYDRLNRRKIDLIPEPQWADPPKAQIGALLTAVEQRLCAAHVEGGIHAIISLTERLAEEQHLAARITSDVKHIEVGLTDKADSIAWIKRELLQPAGIAWHDVLVVGDEFGPIAGFAGSDDRLRVGVADAVVISVGAEPNGVPAGVFNLGGGPPRFRALLAHQIELHRQAPTLITDPIATRCATLAMTLATTPDSAWRFTAQGHRLDKEQAIESQLTISNGFQGARGALELPSPGGHPRMLIAGLFTPANTLLHIPALASGPDWTSLHITLDGRELTLEEATITRTLDFGRGVLLTEWHWELADGQMCMLRTLRGVSLADRALAWHSARIDVTRPAEVRLSSMLAPLDMALYQRSTAPCVQVWQTTDAPHTLAVASTATLDVPTQQVAEVADRGKSSWQWTWMATPDQSAFYTRLVAVARGGLDEDIAPSALALLQQAQHTGFATLFEDHVHDWQERWHASDVVIEGDAHAQQALRFALYHLISAAHPTDPTISIGARALTGDAYSGHVFWDTETFLLPFYTYTWPTAARTLLLYRYHTLPAARAKAAQMGYRGALYAWESTDTGAETTPEQVIDHTGKVIEVYSGRFEQHISADIAYAIWQYWMATLDVDFLLEAGAAIILETARFWASRGTLEDDGRYHIRGVIGPDEYHELIDDNAFTNGMARWNLECGVALVQLLSARWPDRWQELRTELDISAEELAQWSIVAEGLVMLHDATTNLYEQFDGYYAREPVDLTQYAKRTVPMDVVLGHEQIQRTQVIKQADVVMLLAMLWERFDAATRTANFRYYEPRTGHGSSLSPAIYALVAARLGDTTLALRYFKQAAAIDLSDGAGNEAHGLHMATLGGIWQATLFGFAGLQLSATGIGLDPHLPKTWTTLRFPLQWRGSQLNIAITRMPLAIAVTLQGAAVTLQLGTKTFSLESGKTSHFVWDRRRHLWRVVQVPSLT